MTHSAMLHLRPTTTEEIHRVMGIISQAQEWFASQGIDQWQNGYPNAEVIATDIKQGNSYLLFLNNTPVATAMISFDGEPTYAHIEGEWLTHGSYAVVHRIAVAGNFKGQNMASFIFKQVALMCKAKGIEAIRIDTHSQNQPMQRVLQKTGFHYCGTVYVSHGAQRRAYEKQLLANDYTQWL